MSQSIVSVAPFHMKYSRKSDFEPEFVSIGPYYYSKFEGSQHMEDIKEDCISYFFNRPGDSSKQTPTECIDMLLRGINPYDMEARIREWYGRSSIHHLDQKTLFEILLRDSCFVIRIILSDAGEGHKSTFFQLDRDIKRLRFDLLLLENQIPFFFLMKVYKFFYKNKMLPRSKSQSAKNSASNSQNGNLNQSNAQGPTPTWLTSLCCIPHNVESPKSHVIPPQSNTSPQDTSSQSSQEQTGSTSVPNLLPQNPQDTPQSDKLKQFLKELESFISLDTPWKFNEYEISEEPCHLLDLYWRRCLPLNDVHWAKICSGNNPQNPGESLQSSWVTIQVRTNAPKRIKNAYELYKRAGVKFGKTKHDEGFGLTFQKKGILQLPHLQLDPSQAKLLVNLVAFEEFKPSSEKILTSYVLLIDGLINTEKDIELLQRYNVLTNKLGSSQMASIYFNDIGNLCSVNYEDHYCQKQFQGLNSYYNSYWRCKFAILKNNYFNSPWSVISFFAGLALLAITIAQLVLASINTHFNLKHHKH